MDGEQGSAKKEQGHTSIPGSFGHGHVFWQEAKEPGIEAGWRMASTAMRLAIFAASLDAFYLFINRLRFETSLR